MHWCIGRHVIPICLNSQAKIISSFVGLKCLLSDRSMTLTTRAFLLKYYLILQYSLTQYAHMWKTLYKKLKIYWSNENFHMVYYDMTKVYKIAKEIQFLKLGEFDKVFLVWGTSTHRVLASIGKLLEGSGLMKFFFKQKSLDLHSEGCSRCIIIFRKKVWIYLCYPFVWRWMYSKYLLFFMSFHLS